MSKARYHDMRLRDQLKLSRMLLTAQMAHAYNAAYGESFRETIERAKAEISSAISDIDERLAK
tara:strand:- start:164 stop:352 length:189 start_codon:yes stop_codon:yes gene_type:complete